MTTDTDDLAGFGGGFGPEPSAIADTSDAPIVDTDDAPDQYPVVVGAIGDAFMLLRDLDEAAIGALRDATEYGELADVFLSVKVIAERVAAIESAAKVPLLHEARRRFDEDGTATSWRRDLGTVVLTIPAPAPAIVDEQAFVEWASADFPTLIDTRPRAVGGALDALKRSGYVVDGEHVVNPDTGDQPAGVTVRERDPYLSRRGVK